MNDLIFLCIVSTRRMLLERNDDWIPYNGVDILGELIRSYISLVWEV